MSIERKIKLRVRRRAYRVRGRLLGDRPRVSVSRSLRHMYAQVIDDAKSVTLVGLSSGQLKDVSGDKKKIAHELGLELAQRTLAQGVKEITFDRGSARYHGRVKAFAEGLRQGGLNF